MKPAATPLRSLETVTVVMDHPVSKDRARIVGVPARWLVGVALGCVALLAAYACVPRQADLTRFDPNALGLREMLMWRHYYEKRYFALFRDIYDVVRRQYGFSPLDSVRIAVAAASSAHSFQSSTSRAEAEAALPGLQTYFQIVARGAKVPIEVEDAARTELAWWQARREAVPPEQYGLIIAHVASLVYGVDGEDLRQSGIVRAQAMAFRDAHDANMSTDDWSAIADQLKQAYRLLKRSLNQDLPARTQ